MIREEGDGFALFRDELRAIARSLPENLIVFDQVGSTNRSAKRIVKAAPPALERFPRTLVLAREQTRGRGRLGRSWLSAPDRGLYCTLIEPLESSEDARSLPLAAAVAVCTAVRQAGVEGCRLKWPNDLLAGGRKLGGILVEIVAPSGARGPTAIVGFGLNLGPLDAERAAIGATTLAGEGVRDLTPVGLLPLAASELRRRRHVTVGPSELAARYRELLGHELGDELRWSQGEGLVEGRYAGVDEQGHLLLDTRDGRRVVAVGDIMER